MSASYDHTVKLWDVEKSQLVNSSEVPGLVQCVSFNMAGQWVNLDHLLRLLCEKWLLTEKTNVWWYYII